MGLSRNKVAVSEGAAGSPPFYGDREADHTRRDRDFVVKLGQKTLVDVYEYCTDRFCCSIVRIQLRVLRNKPKKVKKKSEANTFHSSLFTLIWGCSSVGRAPALQAGGQGFESLHLHHFLKQRLLPSIQKIA